MTMPHMGGEEAFRELRRVKDDVRVILSSGYNEDETVDRFCGKGLAGFIQKPYGPSDLIPLLQRAIKLRSDDRTQAEAVAESTQEKSAQEGRETILVVDDEDSVRETISTNLRERGYTVYEAASGVTALELYPSKHEQIALVIIDREMPMMSGEETLVQMKAINPSVKAIFCSGHELSIKTSGSELGDAKAIVPKPYDPKEFRCVIRYVLGDDPD